MKHAASLVSALALLAGCGSGDEPEPEPPNQATTDLQITVWPAGRSGDKEEATLRCSPAGGSLDEPEEACGRLQELERPFVKPAGQIACTEIYGGPALAEVRGTFDGTEVTATFARTDGCEIAHWDRHKFLFPVQL